MFEKNKIYKRYILFCECQYDSTDAALDSDSLDEIEKYADEYPSSCCSYYIFDCESRKIISNEI